MEEVENIFRVNKFLVLFDLERTVRPRDDFEEKSVFVGIIPARSEPSFCGSLDCRKNRYVLGYNAD